MEDRVISTQVLIQKIFQNSILTHLANQKDFFFFINLQTSWVGQISEIKAFDLLVIPSQDEQAAHSALNRGLLESSRIRKIDMFCIEG